MQTHVKFFEGSILIIGSTHTKTIAEPLHIHAPLSHTNPPSLCCLLIFCPFININKQITIIVMYRLMVNIKFCNNNATTYQNEQPPKKDMC